MVIAGLLTGAKPMNDATYFGLGICARRRIDLLRRAGFAGIGVAVEDRPSRRPEQHHAFHHLLHLGRGHRRNHAMLLRGMKDHGLGVASGGNSPATMRGGV